MYIEFDVSSLIYAYDLFYEVDMWAKKYDVRYRRKLVKNTVRLTFDDPAHYNLFAISWAPLTDVADLPWRFVEPMDPNFGKE